MVSNVTKNTFFYKFFKLNLSGENLSLKQLLQKEILKAIAIYQKQYSDFNNWQQITVSLPQKIVLLPLQKSSQIAIYRCAIAYSLANLARTSPFLVASELVLLLSFLTAKYSAKESLEIAVTVVDSGLIDFYIWKTEISTVVENHNIVMWLNGLVKNFSAKTPIDNSYLFIEKRQIPSSLFSLQYIYGRCNSLLNLGAREQLISLVTDSEQYLRWQIVRPSFIEWSDCQNRLFFACHSEYHLIWQICWIVDCLLDNTPYSTKHWSKFISRISEVWLNFSAECNFCGAIRQDNFDLAIARLGLIALLHWCLEAILILQLRIIPQKEV